MGIRILKLKNAISWGAVVLVVGSISAGERTDFSAADLEFFENSVRPLLISACGECHGAKTQWGGLRVDARSSLISGGDSGAAFVPGKPGESLLITAVRRTGGIEMPPEKPLSAEQIAVLERWVEMGAPWPKEVPPEKTQNEQHRTHWAFQPISRSRPPETSRPEWCRTPVDQFVLAKLETTKLAPSEPADKQNLIRRVTYDLTGLPPTADEVSAFVSDPAPDAYARLVDRLLASPRYGEHWGRHWLDLARYADTKGYVYGREERRFVHSWAYRDWVIKAFNDDLPYDQFLLLQVAADQVAPEDIPSQAAMGFVTLSRRFLGNTHDIIDDRIDVLCRTTMGLTVGCARCHDHKYDPIPTADYYSLYGVFNNSSDRLTPLAAAAEGDNAATKELRERLEKLNQGIKENYEIAENRVRDRVTDYLIAQCELDKYPDVSFSQILSPTDVIPSVVHRWESYLRRTVKSQDPVFIPWHRFAALRDEDFAEKAPEIARDLQALASSTVNPRVAEAFSAVPRSMKEVAERYGKLFITVNQEWRALIKAAVENGSAAPEAFSDTETEALRRVLYGPHSPCSLPDGDGIVGTEFFFDINITLALWKLQSEVDSWLINQPDCPLVSVHLVDREQIDEPRVFRRGNPATKGEDVPRQFPLVVAGADRKSFTKGSGRLELAQGIVSRENQLTARVWVNRLWQHHFGTGIVPTPSDFGIRAPQPEHLLLLDWLAQKLMDEGWSTKAIHRLILLSFTYQQQSTGPTDPAIRQRAEEVDPANHLLWKQNVRRLSFEEFRDTMLMVSGELDSAAGGRAAPMLSGADNNHLRTVYGFIDRQSLPDVYRIFDFANPDLHIPVRSETTVSQQALFALNHPFIANRARALAGRLDEGPNSSPASRIAELYQLVYQRPATASDLENAVNFLATTEIESQPDISPEQLAWTYGYGAVNSTGTGIESFQALPYFNGTAWQGSPKFPDDKLGWAQLTADGGHPGNDHNHAVIRRWTASMTGNISIDSQAKHEVAAGNGIRCWIISSRGGVLNQFPLHQSSQNLKIESVQVQAGDTIDFVVDINGQLNSDQHLWKIVIIETQQLAGAAGESSGVKTWNSQRDFFGKSREFLTPWQQLVQVLLLSNEFLFID